MYMLVCTFANSASPGAIMRRVLGLLFLLIPFAFAQEPETETWTAEDEAAWVKEFEGSLDYQQGTLNILNGEVSVTTGDKLRFLGAEDAQKLLSEGWGNPPDESTLGMILPADISPFDYENSWAVEIYFEEDGYVSDKDASKINYDKLLKDMQAETNDANAERVEAGYDKVELVGWAAQPRYDAATHKLYWAKEIEFNDDSEHTLNYNIRVLGRKGVLNLNVIASLEQLPEVEAALPGILQTVNFNQGSRYEDFNKSTDKVAKYGIAALIAGGVLAKKGFFVVILAVLAKSAKFIIIGVIALGGAVARMFGRGKSQA
jgi:uncharacterized membrane-anchored protein